MLDSTLNDLGEQPTISFGSELNSTPDQRSPRTVFRKKLEGKRNKSSLGSTESLAFGSSTSPMDVNKEQTGVVRLPNHALDIPIEIKLQEWEGQVQDISEFHFSAYLVDLTANETEESEEVQLPLDDLSESDRALLVPGAVFRWLIGHRFIKGQKERFTRVVIRRLPMWTESEMKAADDEATELHNALFNNCDRRTAEFR